MKAFITTTSLLLVTGCIPSPSQMREQAPPASIEGQGEMARVSSCIVDGLQRVGGGWEVDARPVTDQPLTEVVMRAYGCQGACAVIDVYQLMPKRVRVDYWLRRDLIFRGTVEQKVRKVIVECAPSIA